MISIPPVEDLKRVLHHNLLNNRNKIQVYMDYNTKTVDITKYVTCDPYPCLSSFPVIRDHSYEFEYRESSIGDIINSRLKKKG